MTPARVYLEEGAKSVFAVSLDWPGWCRRGRTVGDALETLDAYRGRYGAVVGTVFAPGPLEVIGTVAGTRTTDFGAPDARGPWDDDPPSGARRADPSTGRSMGEDESGGEGHHRQQVAVDRIADLDMLPDIGDEPVLVARASGRVELEVYHGDFRKLDKMVPACDVCIIDTFPGGSPEAFVKKWHEITAKKVITL